MNDATNGCEMLARIPPELFHQICLHLAAQDLLALCCASRWCNARLAAASAVWRCKWLCLGYAPPPPSVTPALVSFKALVALVTKRGCFFCSDAHTTAIDWFELARFCRRCKYASFRSRANERTAPNDGTLLTDLKGFGTWAAAVLKPRRQRSPYAFYLMEQLASVKRGNPEKTDLEARNEVRRKWESEPDELKR
ncbi:hypothetical protein BC830DRAFT_617559 [Chytriomyces sp. MP71]|nr:hypothetical protein BC830DRAFT_617559 [Chytriomyces sp. MP71]